MEIIALGNFVHNNFIKSENLRSAALVGYLDMAVDSINERIQAKFPTFTEWPAFVEAYNDANADVEGFVALDPLVYVAIPDRYLRSVVAPGAALNFFTNDAEGEQVSNKYYIQFETGLAMMIRDYLDLVPDMFQNNEGGFITTSFNNSEDSTLAVERIVINNGDNRL